MKWIDKIFLNAHFKTILIGSSLFLFLLFIGIFFLGIIDREKRKRKKEEPETLEDISFNPEEKMMDFEDVTFEIPSLTKNLENFKESMEKALQENNFEELEHTTQIKKRKELEEQKTTPILDKEKIENTALQSILIKEPIEEEKEFLV